MFDSDTRWFIHCDTCPGDRGPWPAFHGYAVDKDDEARHAREDGWDIREELHRCPRCVREGRGAVAVGGTETAR